MRIDAASGHSVILLPLFTGPRERRAYLKNRRCVFIQFCGMCDYSLLGMTESSPRREVSYVENTKFRYVCYSYGADLLFAVVCSGACNTIRTVHWLKNRFRVFVFHYDAYSFVLLVAPVIIS